MMEVQRHSLQNVRRSGKTFSPEGSGLPPPVSTGLSLGVNGMDSTNPTSSLPNTGYISSVTSTRTPLPTNTTIGGFELQPPVGAALNSNQGSSTPPLVPVGTGDFMSLAPPGIITGNQAVFLSGPSAELPASLPIGGFGTVPMMPTDLPFELPQENRVNILGDPNQSVSRVIPSNVAVPNDEKARDDTKQQFNILTEPELLEGSKPDLNMDYSNGETQLVSESQLGADTTQAAFAGETQPVNDQCFDDMVVLQDDTLAASTIPIENGSQPASLYEPLQIVNVPPLEVPFDVEVKDSRDLDIQDTGKEIGVEPHISKGRNENALGTKAPAFNGGQEFKEGGLDTSDPQLVVRQDPLSEDKEIKADESTVTENNNAGNPGPAKKEVVAQQDIQAIMGRKVMKKFGSKNYKGEVLDYDSENHWFKVVYEDGDQEDLELVEVKEILFIEDKNSDIPTGKRKQPLAKGGTRKRARKQKSKSQDSGKPRGRPKKKGSSTQTKKKPLKARPMQESELFDSKPGPAALKSKKERGAEAKKGSQVKSTGKRKRSSDAETEHETRAGAKEKKGGEDRLSSRKSSVRKSPSRKRGRKATQKGSVKAKRRSLSKLPAEQTRGKRRKSDGSDDLESLVGKLVKKGFDGSLYKGKVLNFDRKTEYFKVKYEDGDQEDLELEELKGVLVE
ncbi:hypothetical protein L7F22_053262 [Adiantum nelumboides]|nr:hypothetical protein [Adiantum nelumboides]